MIAVDDDKKVDSKNKGRHSVHLSISPIKFELYWSMIGCDFVGKYSIVRVGVRAALSSLTRASTPAESPLS